jgi:hypothetical protein
MKQGVPQGSILGLHLFVLYISDLPLNVGNVKMVLFVDYINILVIDKDYEVLQSKLRTVMIQLIVLVSKE